MPSEDQTWGTREPRENVYRTAIGGRIRALRPGLSAVVALGFGVFAIFWLKEPDEPFTQKAMEFLPFLGGVLVMALLFASLAAWYVLQERNSRVIVSDTGLTLVNWRKVERFIAWENLLSLVQMDNFTAGGSGGWLAAELPESAGHPQRMRIANWYGSCPPAMDALREKIVARRGFSEVQKAPRNAAGRAVEGLSQRRERTWR